MTAPFHALDADAVFARVESTAEGLSTAAAHQRLLEFGRNELPQTPPEPALRRFLRQLNDPMIFVLLAACLLTVVLREWADATFIALVILVNSLVGFIQEGKAADALESIRSMLSVEAAVLRDGEWDTVDAAELVPGDIVRVNPGDKVPADLRLVEASSLLVEESALTGESVPAEKHTTAVSPSAALGDRSPLAFSGTTVVGGTGRGVVVATGQNTELGAVTRLVDEVDAVTTPLVRAMARLSSLIAVVCVVLAAVMSAVSAFVYREPLADVALAAIGFAVAAIPEGLPAVIAITLALGVRTMASRNAIARRMESVEALGSVSAICSDKTGTLTLNEMTVRRAVAARQFYDVEGTGYAPIGDVVPVAEYPAADSPVAVLGSVAALCTDASVVPADSNTGGTTAADKVAEWQLVGEPTDGAIACFAQKVIGDAASGERLGHVPFDSAVKYMATRDRLPAGTDWQGQSVVINVKGAPDRVMDLCTHEMTPTGDVIPLDSAWWEDAMAQLAAQGMRVLAAARRAEGNVAAGDDALGARGMEGPASASELTLEDVRAGGFTLVGLWGIVDPPRPEVIPAVADVQAAGIRLRMITGDHALTAQAIARDIGIHGAEDEDAVIDGATLDQLDDAAFREAARRCVVFARTSPEHKIRLVRALQADGEVVAMTGDGVNDAPALRQADIGVAMGIKGTEATKDAADIVLADDNFATIDRAVATGRTIYDNIRKSILFMLPTNGAQGLAILVAMIAGWTLPVTALQVLWVNLITAITLSLSLSFEPAEPGIMARPPRDPQQNLIDRPAALRVAMMSLLLGVATLGSFFWARGAGADLEVARSLAVTTLVVAQCFYLLSARFARVSSVRPALFTTNPWSWASIAAILALQCLFLYVPTAQAVFDTHALGLRHWEFAAVVGVAIFALAEAGKAVGR